MIENPSTFKKPVAGDLESFSLCATGFLVGTILDVSGVCKPAASKGG